MKYTILIVLALLANPLFAQQPSISYLMCDEAKSQLQIRGSFGMDSGSVSIEDTTLGIVSWSDSLIICNLPDRGKGAGGNVQVQTMKGVSNKRALSIIYLEIMSEREQHESGDYWGGVSVTYWHCIWRVDLKPGQPHIIFPFEISKKSDGGGYFSNGTFWVDSSSLKDTGISAFGIVNLKKFVISFKGIYFMGKFAPKVFFSSPEIPFDTIGNIVNLKDTVYIQTYLREIHSYFSGHILFPPSPKNIVTSYSEFSAPLKVYSENNELRLQSQTPLGKTTASLYTIDGRLLKRAKLDITESGIFSVDVSDVHTHFAILVLQTEKGIITKKILF